MILKIAGARRRIAVSLADVASPFDDIDRKLGAIGSGEIGLVLESLRDCPVADLAGIAEFVELEQLGSEGLAAAVSLTFVGIDPQLQSS
jgi:hypothetical protein